MWHHIDSGYRGVKKLPLRDQIVTIKVPEPNDYDSHNHKEILIDVCVPLSFANNRKVKFLSFEMSDSFAQNKGQSSTLNQFEALAYGSDRGTGVSRNTLYKMIYDLIKHYSTMEERYYHLITCFVLSSYYVDVANDYPIIWINGENGTGKTNLGRLISLLSFYGKFVTKISLAALYRGLDFTANLLVLDEMEKMLQEGTNEEVQGLLTCLRGGTGKHGTVSVCTPGKNGQFETDDFRIFSPKIIVSINDMLDKTGALRSRSIKILMRESLKEHDGLPDPQEDTLELRKINQARDACFCHRFYDLFDFLEAYKFIAKTTPMRSRTWDGFKAMFAIAEVYGGEFFSKQEIVSYLIQCVELANESQSSNTTLSGEIKELMDQNEKSWVGQNLFTSEISDRILQYDDDYSIWTPDEKTRKKKSLGRKVVPVLRLLGFHVHRKNKANNVFFDPESYKIVMDVYRSLKPQEKAQGGIDDFTGFVEEEKEQIKEGRKRITGGLSIEGIMNYLSERHEKSNFVFSLETLTDHFAKDKELTEDQINSQKIYIKTTIESFQNSGLVYGRGEGKYNLVV